VTLTSTSVRVDAWTGTNQGLRVATLPLLGGDAGWETPTPGRCAAANLTPLTQRGIGYRGASGPNRPPEPTLAAR
jgi:hypothetical protein